MSLRVPPVSTVNQLNPMIPGTGIKDTPQFLEVGGLE